MITDKMIEVVDKINVNGVNIIEFTNKGPVQTNSFFEEVGTRFKSKLSDMLEEYGPFKISVYCILGYDIIEDNSSDNQLIGGLYRAGTYSISNVETIDTYYKTSVLKIKHVWNNVEVREDEIKTLQIFLEVSE